MEKEFVPYNLSLKLKELGFDERCLAGYYNDGKSLWFFRFHKNSEREPTVAKRFATAPLWQQAFDWFRTEYNLISWVYKTNIDTYYFSILRKDRYLHDFTVNCVTYEEAQLACLEKLIELCKKIDKI